MVPIVKPGECPMFFVVVQRYVDFVTSVPAALTHAFTFAVINLHGILASSGASDLVSMLVP